MTPDAIVVGKDICYFCFARVGRRKKEILPKSDIVRLGAQPSARRAISGAQGSGYAPPLRDEVMPPATDRFPKMILMGRATLRRRIVEFRASLNTACLTNVACNLAAVR